MIVKVKEQKQQTVDSKSHKLTTNKRFSNSPQLTTVNNVTSTFIRQVVCLASSVG